MSTYRGIIPSLCLSPRYIYAYVQKVQYVPWRIEQKGETKKLVSVSRTGLPELEFLNNLWGPGIE
jgi:hypothetical protein